MHGDLNFFLQFMNSLIPNFITAKSKSDGDTRKKLKSDNKALSGKYYIPSLMTVSMWVLERMNM